MYGMGSDTTQKGGKTGAENATSSNGGFVSANVMH